MDRGWVKLWRKSRDSGLMQRSDVWTFWTWCLLKATHKKCKIMVGHQLVELSPGQFIFGRKKAALELRTSERNVRTCVSFLEKSQNLTIKSTNKYSIISIVNWGIYQGEDLVNDQQNDQQATSRRPAGDQQATTNKNIEKLKNIENDKKNHLAFFNQFWQEYPRKDGKKKATEAFIKIKPDEPQFKKIMNGLNRQISSEQWTRDDGRYIPLPATWLNQERWTDESREPVPDDPEWRTVWTGQIARCVREYAQTQDEQAQKTITFFAGKYGVQAITQLIGEDQCRKSQYPEKFKFLE